MAQSEFGSTFNGPLKQFFKRWGIVVLYAIAMAWVEAAVVLDLRTITGRIDPYQPDPLPRVGGLALAELVREAATMVMLLTVGWLAGRSVRARIGYAVIAFGVWDIFYYVFLKVLTGWPNSLLDWDILFLLPLPWWGPVLAPVLIALLMILWGTLACCVEDDPFPAPENWKLWLVALVGIVLALYVFMADALGVVGQGIGAAGKVLPQKFNWPLFACALVLMCVPVWQELRAKTSDLLLYRALNRMQSK